MLVFCAYVSIESIDCFLLLSFELRAILLISLVKTLCLFFFNFSHDQLRITGLQGKREGISFNSSLPLPPASQTLRH